jgi:predicted XRE-type DNA-binding protein
MRSANNNRATHIVKGNVLDALGFAPAEASAIKVKAEILSAILEHVRMRGYTQSDLVAILEEHQPSISNLLKGKIANVSIEKLLRYADLLQLRTTIAIRPIRSGAKKLETAKTLRTAV